MTDATITYFPVKNGDTSLIRLSDGTSIVIDCNITQDSRDNSKKEWYHVHEHLLESVEKDGTVPYVDAFILTHPDTDHCRGFQGHLLHRRPGEVRRQARQGGLDPDRRVMVLTPDLLAARGG